MNITAEEYYDNNLENYNLLNKIDPMTAKQAMQMMEEYHQAKLKLLGIGDVVCQREQFYCWESGEAGAENPLCEKQCDHCAKLYPKQ